MKTAALLTALLLLITGCGYKPAATYSRQLTGGQLAAKVKIDIRDPKNSVIMQDRLNESIIQRLHARIKLDPTAEETLYVEMDNIRFTPLMYDEQGYVSVYRAKVVMRFQFKEFRRTVSARYDFSNESTSIISDTQRFEAIKAASLNAIDDFLAELSASGYLASP